MNDVEVIRAISLGQLPHGFLGRRGGMSVGDCAGLNVGWGSNDDREAIAGNRRLAVAALLAEAELATVHQVHSAEVVVAERAWPQGERPRADAMVTDTPNLLLGVLTADCAPVLFADHGAVVVGAAHAGWRGALGGVTDSTIAAMGRSPIAEEAVRVGISIEVERFDLADAGRDEAVDDVSLEVEVRLAGTPFDEEARIVGLMVDEAGAERLVNLVGRLGNAWANGGVDVLAAGTELFHCLDRRVRHAGKRTAPARVGSADDDAVMVGEQHRRAIRGQDAEQQVRPVGDDGIGPGPLVLRPWCVGTDHLGRMDLVHGGERRRRRQSRNGQPPILVDRGPLVIASVTDVEAGKRSGRDSAAAAEEAVRQAAEGHGPDDLDLAHSALRMMMSSSAWLPTMKS